MPAFAVMISAVVLVSIAENLAAAASGGTALLDFGELVARSHRFFGLGDCRREGSGKHEDGQDEFPHAPSFHKKTNLNARYQSTIRAASVTVKRSR
jgi:hypothetical protein